MTEPGVPRDVSARLSADHLSLVRNDEKILHEVSLDFSSSRTVAVTGASGSGKTTLLHCLSGLERNYSGTVSLLGHDIAALTADELAELRLGQVGFVFQSSDLVPELTLRQNIALPLNLARASRRRTKERVAELVSALGLEGCADRRPEQVSGGQQQRCAVVRAVVARPAVVFADEPTGALDKANRDLVLDLLLDQVNSIDGLMVTVTHDADLASRFERRIELSDGRPVADSEGLGELVP